MKDRNRAEHSSCCSRCGNSRGDHPADRCEDCGFDNAGSGVMVERSMPSRTHRLHAAIAVTCGTSSAAAIVIGVVGSDHPISALHVASTIAAVGFGIAFGYFVAIRGERARRRSAMSEAMERAEESKRVRHSIEMLAMNAATGSHAMADAARELRSAVEALTDGAMRLETPGHERNPPATKPAATKPPTKRAPARAPRRRPAA